MEGANPTACVTGRRGGRQLVQRHCGKTELGMLKEQNKGLSVQGSLVKDDELERYGFGFCSV